MVSLRCKLLVKAELQKLDISYNYLELGEVHSLHPISQKKLQILTQALDLSGLELMDDKNAVLIEKIKNTIIELVHYSDEIPDINYSVFISKKIGEDYYTLSQLFSKTKGITIEQYIIFNKIERAKELIMYDEVNLTDIAYKLHYSSVAHLSHQFRKVTGLTPSYFKSMQKKKLEKIKDLN